MRYSPIRHFECEQVIALHRRAFSESELRYSIYSAMGITRYLENLTRFPGRRSQNLLMGAWDGDLLAGYAHYKALPDSWHLNYVAVDAQYRGRNVGGELVRRWLHTGKERGYKELSLDVAPTNTMAVDWYRRIGLKEVSTQHTHIFTERSQPADPFDMDSVEVHDWENAQAWQAVYGFSQFRVACRERYWEETTVGRLGDDYFRVPNRPASALVGFLHQLDASRTLLVTSPVPLTEIGSAEVFSTIRMRAYLDEVVSRWQ
jgi:ribosomal protein S18 acetylase RimI-like enzyme